MFVALATNTSLMKDGSVLPLDLAILDKTVAISSIRFLDRSHLKDSGTYLYYNSIQTSVFKCYLL